MNIHILLLELIIQTKHKQVCPSCDSLIIINQKQAILLFPKSI
jgi:hypothetical protein